MIIVDIPQVTAVVFVKSSEDYFKYDCFALLRVKGVFVDSIITFVWYQHIDVHVRILNPKS